MVVSKSPVSETISRFLFDALYWRESCVREAYTIVDNYKMFEFSKLVFKNLLHTLFIGSNHRITLYGQPLHLQLYG